MQENRLTGYVLTAMFAGIAAAVGYLLIAVPNVEAITLMMFLSGWTLGLKRGLTAAFIASILYFGFNPQGTFPPLLAAQIIGSTVAPIAGYMLRKHDGEKLMDKSLLALSALVLTLWFDLLTNLAYPLTAGFDMKGIVVVLLGGIPFSMIHVGGNILMFVLVAPILMRIVRPYRLLT